MPAGPPWVGCFVLSCLLVAPPPPPMRLTFDLELLRFFAAWAAPERPGAMAGANAIGSAAGTTRNVAARNATRRLRDIISSQAGMNIKVPYHGCNAPLHSKRATVRFKRGHCGLKGASTPGCGARPNQILNWTNRHPGHQIARYGTGLRCYLPIVAPHGPLPQSGLCKMHMIFATR
jgi:hypothetical protein